MHSNVPDAWIISTSAILESYSDPYFQGDKLVRDRSIELLTGENKFKAFLVAVARLSLDVSAFEEISNGKAIALTEPPIQDWKWTDVELNEFHELQERFNVLSLLQISAIHANINFPGREDLMRHVQATKDTLFEIALRLGDENSIRLLARQMFDSLDDANLQVALLSRINWLYPNSESIALTVLNLIASKNFALENPIEVLIKLYKDNLAFPKLIAEHILENFTDFLPNNYNDLDQALLLRFIAPIVGQEQIEDVYERYIKLGLEGENELELVILDRLAALKHEEKIQATEGLVLKFREILDSTPSIPDSWDLS